MKTEKNTHFVKSLEALKPNKNFVKKEKLRQKRLEKDAQDEWPPLRREKQKALKAAKKEAAKKEAAKPVKKSASKVAGKATVKNAKSAKGAAVKSEKKTPKSKRRVINEIANAATGRESLRKAQARALVEKKKAAKAAEVKAASAKKTTSAKKAVSATTTKKRTQLDKAASAAARQSLKAVKQEKKTEVPPVPQADVEPPLSQRDVERALLQRAITGSDDIGHGAQSSAVHELRDDPTLYPPLAFYDDYAEKKAGERVSEDTMLSEANRYFRDVRRRERQLNITAARHIAKMKAINRRGGDKDGFRYVVPRNTKQLVRQMMLNSAQHSEEADVNPDSLVSTFLGDGEEDHTSDKPQRRHRKRSSTLSDFYQFQVSKRWTQNAEKFLKRGRANKSMFEATKRQRSIRKL